MVSAITGRNYFIKVLISRLFNKLTWIPEREETIDI
jgi:hypothetical protein